MQSEKSCSVPVSILYEAAFRLYSYNNFPMANVLLMIILDAYPEHEAAKILYETITGKAHERVVDKHPRLSYDYQKKKYVLRDKVNGTEHFFQSYQEADAFFRGTV